MEFKKLEIKPEGSWLKRMYQSQHVRKSALFALIGAIGSLAFFYYTEGQHMEVIATSDIVKSLILGGFIGLFITNSPCARGKC